MLMFKPDCVAGFAHAGREVGFGKVLGDATLLGSDGWRLEMGVVVRLTRDMAERLYAVHAGKAFHGGLLDFATGGPSFVSVWSSRADDAWRSGRGVVESVRRAYGRDRTEVTGPANLVHGSDGPENAVEEVRWAMRVFTLRVASAEGGLACG
jgi:nucleoside diphosphate kinase